jgi:rod shape determining protein RodA
VCADNHAHLWPLYLTNLRLAAYGPWFQGFDGPLAFAVFLLACAGMLTMYSSGFDHGTRFADHGRNMLIAGFIMFVVAQVPPQRLMAFAVPLYAGGWRC